MNKSSLKKVLIALTLSACQLAGGYERVADVVTTREGSLREILGDTLFEIDSLSVNGPINEDDFRAMWEASFHGRLLSIGLANAAVSGARIPDNAFWHEEEQRADDGSITPVKLEKIYIGPSVKVVGEEAFSHARNLSILRFPKGIELFERRAFYDCRSIIYLSLPATLQRLMPECMAGLSHICGIWSWALVPPELVFYEHDPEVGPFGRHDFADVIEDSDLESVTKHYVFVFAPIESYKEYNKTLWTYFGLVRMMHDYDFLPDWDVSSSHEVFAVEKGVSIRAGGHAIEIIANGAESDARGTYEVFDAMGRLVCRGTLEDAATSESVPSGIYLVRTAGVVEKLIVN